MDPSLPATVLLTPALLAELARAPLSAVRRWTRRGFLVPESEVHRLPRYASGEVGPARLLGELLAGGVSLGRIDRQVERLTTHFPALARPLAELPLFVAEGRLLLRAGDDVQEPTGQRWFDFDASEEDEGEAALLPMTAAAGEGNPPSARELAAELDEAGDLAGAIEAGRAILMESGGAAEDQFLLAELLYRQGDRSAARERYYAALERDESYVEARANLGCLLVELGDLDLAVAAFAGALVHHADFPDAHYHLARTLDLLDRPVEAAYHWRRVLEVAPLSPWSEEAREALD